MKKITIMSVDPGLNTGLVMIQYRIRPEEVKILRAETWRADSEFKDMMRAILSNIPLRPLHYICEDFRLRVSEAKGAASNDPRLHASQVIGALKWELSPDRLTLVEPSRMSACSLDELERMELEVGDRHQVSALRHAIAYGRRTLVHPPVKNAGPKIVLRRST